MDNTPRLNLPFIAPPQAQKHVTFNEAMLALDRLVQPAVLSRTAAAPASPAEGDAYLVPPGATGSWAGRDGHFAHLHDGGWSFRAPAGGWLAYVADSTEIVIYRLGAWLPLVTTGGTSVAMFGINAAPDTTNRLTLHSDAALFSHAGSSHRLKLNKAAPGDTASTLFQTGFSGRAAFGLAGDDDFHVKVSAGGATWTDALKLDKASGLLTLPQGQLAFPAAQNPSSDPNTLDDYAEGTRTPSVTFSTPGDLSTAVAVATGRYVKVGRLVMVNFTFVGTPTHSTAGGLLHIAGLPFTASDGSGELAKGALDFQGITQPGYTSFTCSPVVATSLLEFWCGGSGVSRDTLNAADVPRGGVLALIGTVSYGAA